MNAEIKKVLIELRDGKIGADTAETLITKEFDIEAKFLENLLSFLSGTCKDIVKDRIAELRRVGG